MAHFAGGFQHPTGDLPRFEVIDRPQFLERSKFMNPQMPPDPNNPSPYPRDPMLMSTGASSPSTPEEKQNTFLMWLLSIFLGFIPSLVFFLIAKPEQAYMKRQSALALTLMIGTTVAYIVLAITVVGLLLFPVLGIFVLVITIMGAIATNKGEDFNPPVITGLCKSIFKL
jgi:uncharacterized protein